MLLTKHFTIAIRSVLCAGSAITATSTTTKDVLGAENAMSVWKFNGLVMTQKGNSAMSKRVIALYERSYKYRAFYGYFKGWMCVGAYAKNASFTRQINDAVVYDDEHQREMNDAISSLRCTLGYSDMIIRAEEIEE